MAAPDDKTTSTHGIDIEAPDDAPPAEEGGGIAWSSLFYFASPRDRFSVGLGACLYLLVGATNASMQIIIGEGLKAQPDDGKLASSGRTLFTYLLFLGLGLAALMATAVLNLLLARQRQMARWKLEYLKAIVRQDVGWFDINKPQELASRIGEAIVHIDKAHSVTTYQSLLPLGQLIGGLVISLAFKWDMALIACSMGFFLCAPASFTQMRWVASPPKGALTRPRACV